MTWLEGAIGIKKEAYQYYIHTHTLLTHTLVRERTFVYSSNDAVWRSTMVIREDVRGVAVVALATPFFIYVCVCVSIYSTTLVYAVGVAVAPQNRVN